MSFKKPETPQDTSTADLLCSANGCGNLWSVQADGKPKCSFHQWFGSAPAQYGSMHLQIGDYLGDKKAWARRIMDRHNSGQYVHKLSLKFAMQALKMNGEEA
jgi:hypothetical protein